MWEEKKWIHIGYIHCGTSDTDTLHKGTHLHVWMMISCLLWSEIMENGMWDMLCSHEKIGGPANVNEYTCVSHTTCIF